jgi:hypothetical protein
MIPPVRECWRDIWTRDFSPKRKNEVYGNFMEKYNVSKAWDIINAKTPKERQAAFIWWYRMSKPDFITVNETLALSDKTDFSVPLLVVPRMRLIDGWHRLYKAKFNHLLYMPAFLLTDAEAESIYKQIV